MNAKAKVNFINSVAGGHKIPCPVCNTLNKTDSLFCTSCGTKLSVSTTEQINEKPVTLKGSEQQDISSDAFETVKRSENANKTRNADIQKSLEPVSVFAQGLPSWDVVPPQVMVRRKKRR